MRCLALLFAVLLTGCAGTVVKQYPPQELLADCYAQGLKFETNEDVAISAVRLAGALKLCNIDKAKLREWSVKE